MKYIYFNLDYGIFLQRFNCWNFFLHVYPLRMTNKIYKKLTVCQYSVSGNHMVEQTTFPVWQIPLSANTWKTIIDQQLLLVLRLCDYHQVQHL